METFESDTKLFYFENCKYLDVSENNNTKYMYKIESCENNAFCIKILNCGKMTFKIGYDYRINKMTMIHNSEMSRVERILRHVENIALYVRNGDTITFNFEISDDCNMFNSCDIPDEMDIYICVESFVTDSSKEIDTIQNSLQQLNITIIQNDIIGSIGEYFKKMFYSTHPNVECKVQKHFSIMDCLNSTKYHIYIILLNREKHHLLPTRFIFYQIEQKTSVFLTNPVLFSKTICMMRLAECVWEFSQVPTDVYKNFCTNKLIWAPMPFVYECNICEKAKKFSECKYDIFFFGHKNERRERILNKLKEHFNIKIGWGVYKDEKNKYIAKSKIILNIHFYKETGLETCRINEILNHGKLIVSEKSILDTRNMDLYKDLVIFTDEIDDNMENINQLIQTLKYYLSKSNYYNQMKRNIAELEKLSLGMKTKYSQLISG